MHNRKQNFKLAFLIMMVLLFVSAAQGQLEQTPSQGLITRLIEIKYTAELNLSMALKKETTTVHNDKFELPNEKDSVLAIYNTLRLKIDGFVYQLSADMIAANSPRKIRLLNAWCLQQPSQLNRAKGYYKNIDTYVQALKDIDAFYRKNILDQLYNNAKTVNLSTNVFYLLKDSYTIVKGLTDLKTQKTMAIIELLDHTRLLSPGEVVKQGK